MAGVNVPGSPSDPMKTILPVAGSVVGGIFGGPAGSALGGKLGSALTKGGADPGAIQTQAPDQPDALQRRLQGMGSDPQEQLAQADAALKQLPQEYQEKYGPTIAAARQAAAQGA